MSRPCILESQTIPCFSPPPRPLRSGGLIFGLVLIALGTLWTFGNLGYDFDGLFEYWPVVLILIGLAKLLAGSPSGGSFWILVGGLFLLAKLSTQWGLEELWPLFLILIGLRVMTRSFDRGGRRPRSTRESFPPLPPPEGTKPGSRRRRQPFRFLLLPQEARRLPGLPRRRPGGGPGRL